MSPSEFVSKVVKHYNDGIGIFSKKINAEELIPSGADDFAKALYIFYVLQLDYAMKSQTLYVGALKLYYYDNSFFDPKYILALSEEDLANNLKGYLHPRYINEALRRYRINSLVLLEKYNGDPRLIFTGSYSCKELLVKLKAFRGFGPKIGNFFIRTMLNTFGYSYPDIESMMPPVDVHDVRIAFFMRYIDSDAMSEKNVACVKKLWNQACRDSGESWLVFDKALWLLGSEGKPKSQSELLKLLLL